MWKAFTDIPKQNAFDLYLSAFGCERRNFINIFEISFGAIDKILFLRLPEMSLKTWPSI